MPKNAKNRPKSAKNGRFCLIFAALTNFGSSLAGAACDGQPNVGEATCSEARFAPKGQVANEVSAAIPPDARSASGGTLRFSGFRTPARLLPRKRRAAGEEYAGTDCWPRFFHGSFPFGSSNAGCSASLVSVHASGAVNLKDTTFPILNAWRPLRNDSSALLSTSVARFSILSFRRISALSTSRGPR